MLAAQAKELRGPKPGNPEQAIEPSCADGDPTRQDLFMAKVHSAQVAMAQPNPLMIENGSSTSDGDPATLGASAAAAILREKPDLFKEEVKEVVVKKKKERSRRRSASHLGPHGRGGGEGRGGAQVRHSLLFLSRHGL